MVICIIPLTITKQHRKAIRETGIPGFMQLHQKIIQDWILLLPIQPKMAGFPGKLIL